MTNMNQYGNCPHCKTNWDGGDIFETLREQEYYETDEEAKKAASHYGWSETNKVRFSRLIGVETPVYDGTSFWQCPDCRTMWNRFSGQKVETSKTDETSIS